MDLEKIKEAQARMNIVLPHIQAAAKEARAEGAVGLAIIMEKPDGSGRLTARFEAEEFFADLAILAAVPDLLAALDASGEASERQGIALAEAHKMIADRDNEIARLRALAREGWQAARDAWEAEDWGDAKRIETALEEIEEAS